MTATLYRPSAAGFDTDRIEVYRRLRDDHPVHRLGEQYLLTRFEDVWAAVHDWQRFSSAGLAEGAGHQPMMIYMDPPRHRELRVLVSRAFTPRRVAGLEPRIRTIARELLDAAGPRADLAGQFAAKLPSRIMAELIGIPEEQRETFRELTESFIETDGRTREESARRLQRIHDMFDDLLQQRRRRPADDLMSALLAAEVDGQRLTDDELQGFCFLLLIAGNDTTTSLIGNGIALLAEHPEQRAELVADPSLITGAVEEMVRLESPTQVLPRRATRDVELHGVTIPEGSRVLLCWGAANLDEREFADPARFDIHRGAPRHLGFGRGIHFCIGSALAIMEARVAFEELLRHAPQYRLEADRERYASSWALAWKRLPVSF